MMLVGGGGVLVTSGVLDGRRLVGGVGLGRGKLVLGPERLVAVVLLVEQILPPLVRGVVFLFDNTLFLLSLLKQIFQEGRLLSADLLLFDQRRQPGVVVLLLEQFLQP